MDDVVVIGAGPAGSVVARLLALRGLKVRLLERAAFPKRKPCGESLNPGAVAALARVGTPAESLLADGAGELDGGIVRGWRLANNRLRLEASYPPGRYGIGCRRELLDERLVREACRAGVLLDEHMHVEGIVWNELGHAAGVYGRSAATGKPFRLPARLVVGADGLRSAIARSAGLASRPGRLRKAAFTARLIGVEALEDAVELHTEPDLVVGVAPLGGGLANLTLALQGAAAASAAKDKAGFMLEAARRQPWLAERLAGAALAGEVLASGPFDRPVRAAALPGLVLVGDAAGYYDPLTGQGIYRAIRSAELAAPRVAESLASGSFRPLAQYERERRKEFAPGVRLQRLIEWSSRQPPVWNAALRGLSASPRLKEALAGRIGDCRVP
ncbi:NAD(P)/FAD-dependent oxidoreductase [Paenibacillus thailandensis]|uniref:NAD(P)/FAD-dependent oxidoreductase n=1 Tax=Paenibacillus thailandensis TaxID=393250 RepID=A0ABW5QUA9_9BACL